MSFTDRYNKLPQINGTVEPLRDVTDTLNPGASLPLSPVGTQFAAGHAILAFTPPGEQNIAASPVGTQFTAGHAQLTVTTVPDCCGVNFKATPLACFNQFQAFCCDE